MLRGPATWVWLCGLWGSLDERPGLPAQHASHSLLLASFWSFAVCSRILRRLWSLSRLATALPASVLDLNSGWLGVHRSSGLRHPCAADAEFLEPAGAIAKCGDSVERVRCQSYLKKATTSRFLFQRA